MKRNKKTFQKKIHAQWAFILHQKAFLKNCTIIFLFLSFLKHLNSKKRKGNLSNRLHSKSWKYFYTTMLIKFYLNRVNYEWNFKGIFWKITNIFYCNKKQKENWTHFLVRDFCSWMNYSTNVLQKIHREYISVLQTHL